MVEDDSCRALKIFLLSGNRHHPAACPSLRNEFLQLRGTPLKLVFVSILRVEVEPFKIAEAAVLRR